MESLIVSTDLSSNSKAGIKLAAQLAKQLKSRISVLYVAEVTQPIAWSNAHYRRYVKETEDKYLPKLKEFVSRTLQTSDFKNIDFKIELSLDVPEAIIKMARKQKASFICMSTRGAGTVKKLFGTNTSAILTRSSIPVIAVPQKYISKPLDTLFFACDFAALNREMKIVQDFANKIKATTKVFHYDYLLHVPENLRKLENKAEKFTSPKTIFAFKKMDIEKTLHKHLIEEVKKEKPSMVVLFTKQDRNWYDRLLLPSEAAEMSFNLNVPLLTFRKKVG